MNETCYACELLATTKEHAPPRLFVPERSSSQPHNCPFLRVAQQRQLDGRGICSGCRHLDVWHERDREQTFNDKVLRLFDVHPVYLHHFSDFRGIKLQGKITGVFEVDIRRMERVMSACVSALHFQDTGEKQTAWEIILANLASASAHLEEQIACLRFLQ